MSMDAIIEYFSNYTIIVVTLGTMVLGITAGTLGSFALLRKQSLLGDAIAHATLPGVCVAFMLTQSKSPLVLLIGAGIAGWIGALCINFITRHSRIKQDAALGIVLSVFFGMGLMLLTIVQKFPTATKAGLDKFLFGNASTLLREDVMLMAVMSLIIFALVIAFWKEFKLIVFDQDYARSIGLNIPFLSTMLSTLIVAAIVIGLQTVGVVLMSAMLVGPAAGGHQTLGLVIKPQARPLRFAHWLAIDGDLVGSRHIQGRRGNRLAIHRHAARLDHPLSFSPGSDPGARQPFCDAF